MGVVKPFPREKLVVGVLSAREDLLTRAKNAMQAAFGAIDFESGPIPFTYTAYYDSEMGSAIERRFWSFERLVLPTELPAIKLKSNEIEESLAIEGNRKVNLDPGLLSLGRLILATTKNRSQRIPLGFGIFAEITLLYEKGRWVPLPWTYPDYATKEYGKIFSKIRENSRDILKQEGY